MRKSILRITRYSLLCMLFYLIPQSRRLLIPLFLHRPIELKLQLLHGIDRKLLADLPAKSLENSHFVGMGIGLFLAKASEEFVDVAQAALHDRQGSAEVVGVIFDRLQCPR